MDVGERDTKMHTVEEALPESHAEGNFWKFRQNECLCLMAIETVECSTFAGVYKSRFSRFVDGERECIERQNPTQTATQ